MKKGTSVPAFVRPLWRYSIDVRKAAGSASFIFVEMPGHLLGSGVSAAFGLRAIGWRTSCTSPGWNNCCGARSAWVPCGTG
ncbi:MAG: hypothetical protein ACLSHC_07885 [Bilophila wadsworthia]